MAFHFAFICYSYHLYLTSHNTIDTWFQPSFLLKILLPGISGSVTFFQFSPWRNIFSFLHLHALHSNMWVIYHNTSIRNLFPYNVNNFVIIFPSQRIRLHSNRGGWWLVFRTFFYNHPIWFSVGILIHLPTHHTQNDLVLITISPLLTYWYTSAGVICAYSRSPVQILLAAR